MHDQLVLIKRTHIHNYITDGGINCGIVKVSLNEDANNR